MAQRGGADELDGCLRCILKKREGAGEYDGCLRCSLKNREGAGEREAEPGRINQPGALVAIVGPSNETGHVDWRVWRLHTDGLRYVHHVYSCNVWSIHLDHEKGQARLSGDCGGNFRLGSTIIGSSCTLARMVRQRHTVLATPPQTRTQQRSTHLLGSLRVRLPHNMRRLLSQRGPQRHTAIVAAREEVRGGDEGAGLHAGAAWSSENQLGLLRDLEGVEKEGGEEDDGEGEGEGGVDGKGRDGG